MKLLRVNSLPPSSRHSSPHRDPVRLGTAAEGAAVGGSVPDDGRQNRLCLWQRGLPDGHGAAHGPQGGLALRVREGGSTVGFYWFIQNSTVSQSISLSLKIQTGGCKNVKYKCIWEMKMSYLIVKSARLTVKLSVSQVNVSCHLKTGSTVYVDLFEDELNLFLHYSLPVCSSCIL